MREGKWTGIAAGAVLLGAFYFFGIHPFIVGGPRMEKFCTNLLPGLSLDELTTRVDDNGYELRAIDSADPNYFIFDRGTMGRFSCDVTVVDGLLVSAKYTLND